MASTVKTSVPAAPQATLVITGLPSLAGEEPAAKEAEHPFSLHPSVAEQLRLRNVFSLSPTLLVPRGTTIKDQCLKCAQDQGLVTLADIVIPHVATSLRQCLTAQCARQTLVFLARTVSCDVPTQIPQHILDSLAPMPLSSSLPVPATIGQAARSLLLQSLSIIATDVGITIPLIELLLRILSVIGVGTVSELSLQGGSKESPEAAARVLIDLVALASQLVSRVLAGAPEFGPMSTVLILIGDLCASILPYRLLYELLQSSLKCRNIDICGASLPPLAASAAMFLCLGAAIRYVHVDNTVITCLPSEYIPLYDNGISVAGVRAARILRIAQSLSTQGSLSANAVILFFELLSRVECQIEVHGQIKKGRLLAVFCYADNVYVSALCARLGLQAPQISTSVVAACRASELELPSWACSAWPHLQKDDGACDSLPPPALDDLGPSAVCGNENSDLMKPGWTMERLPVLCAPNPAREMVNPTLADLVGSLVDGTYGTEMEGVTRQLSDLMQNSAIPIDAEFTRRLIKIVLPYAFVRDETMRPAPAFIGGAPAGLQPCFTAGAVQAVARVAEFCRRVGPVKLPLVSGLCAAVLVIQAATETRPSGQVGLLEFHARYLLSSVSAHITGGWLAISGVCLRRAVYGHAHLYSDTRIGPEYCGAMIPLLPGLTSPALFSTGLWGCYLLASRKPCLSGENPMISYACRIVSLLSSQSAPAFSAASFIKINGLSDVFRRGDSGELSYVHSQTQKMVNIDHLASAALFLGVSPCEEASEMLLRVNAINAARVSRIMCGCIILGLPRSAMAHNHLVNTLWEFVYNDPAAACDMLLLSPAEDVYLLMSAISSFIQANKLAAPLQSALSPADTSHEVIVLLLSALIQRADALPKEELGALLASLGLPLVSHACRVELPLSYISSFQYRSSIFTTGATAMTAPPGTSVNTVSGVVSCAVPRRELGPKWAEQGSSDNVRVGLDILVFSVALLAPVTCATACQVVFGVEDSSAVVPSCRIVPRRVLDATAHAFYSQIPRVFRELLAATPACGCRLTLARLEDEMYELVMTDNTKGTIVLEAVSQCLKGDFVGSTERAATISLLAAAVHGFIRRVTGDKNKPDDAPSVVEALLRLTVKLTQLNIDPSAILSDTTLANSVSTSITELVEDLPAKLEGTGLSCTQIQQFDVPPVGLAGSLQADYFMAHSKVQEHGTRPASPSAYATHLCVLDSTFTSTSLTAAMDKSDECEPTGQGGVLAYRLLGNVSFLLHQMKAFPPLSDPSQPLALRFNGMKLNNSVVDLAAHAFLEESMWGIQSSRTPSSTVTLNPAWSPVFQHDRNNNVKGLTFDDIRRPDAVTDAVVLCRTRLALGLDKLDDGCARLAVTICANSKQACPIQSDIFTTDQLVQAQSASATLAAILSTTHESIDAMAKAERLEGKARDTAMQMASAVFDSVALRLASLSSYPAITTLVFDRLEQVMHRLPAPGPALRVELLLLAARKRRSSGHTVAAPRAAVREILSLQPAKLPSISRARALSDLSTWAPQSMQELMKLLGTSDTDLDSDSALAQVLAQWAAQRIHDQSQIGTGSVAALSDDPVLGSDLDIERKKQLAQRAYQETVDKYSGKTELQYALERTEAEQLYISRLHRLNAQQAAVDAVRASIQSLKASPQYGPTVCLASTILGGTLMRCALQGQMKDPDVSFPPFNLMESELRGLGDIGTDRLIQLTPVITALLQIRAMGRARDYSQCSAGMARQPAHQQPAENPGVVVLRNTLVRLLREQPMHSLPHLFGTLMGDCLTLDKQALPGTVLVDALEEALQGGADGLQSVLRMILWLRFVGAFICRHCKVRNTGGSVMQIEEVAPDLPTDSPLGVLDCHNYHRLMDLLQQNLPPPLVSEIPETLTFGWVPGCDYAPASISCPLSQTGPRLMRIEPRLYSTAGVNGSKRLCFTHDGPAGTATSLLLKCSEGERIGRSSAALSLMRNMANIIGNAGNGTLSDCAMITYPVISTGLIQGMSAKDYYIGAISMVPNCVELFGLQTTLDRAVWGEYPGLLVTERMKLVQALYDVADAQSPKILEIVAATNVSSTVGDTTLDPARLLGEIFRRAEVDYSTVGVGCIHPWDYRPRDGRKDMGYSATDFIVTPRHFNSIPLAARSLLCGVLIPFLCRPPVMHLWFPLRAHSVSAAVALRSNWRRFFTPLSMLGWLIGLGDRHPENILIRTAAPTTVPSVIAKQRLYDVAAPFHIDVEYLLERSAGLQYPERVPFRFTAALVSAFGAEGHEGFKERLASLLRMCRRDDISATLSCALYQADPFVVQELQRDGNGNVTLTQVRGKMSGIGLSGVRQSPEEQAEALTTEAAHWARRGSMWCGWRPWM